MKTLRFTIPLALVGLLTACSGSGGLGGLSPIFGGGPGAISCQPGTSVQLASPQPFQSSTSSVNQITIVADGNSNTLHSTYQNWYVYLIDNSGRQITGGPLSLVDGRSLPHPYNSDFYYNSQLSQTLPSGMTYTAYLARQDQSCNAQPLQSFST